MTDYRLRQIMGDLPPSKNLEEVLRVAKWAHSDADIDLVRRVQADVARMFRGDYEGYQASNNAYHDFGHTMQVMLAMARLLHGAAVADEPASAKGVTLGVIAALFHDIGFIQKEGDRGGTGAKYTITHEERGIEFARRYFQTIGLPQSDFRIVRGMLRSTCLRQPFEDISFKTDEARRLAQLLGTADLIGQMGDPRYLEKLPYLYLEFKEADIGGYRNELDLLDKTSGFWGYIQQRFNGPLGGVYKYARNHFRDRFGIDRNIYIDIIEHQIDYLDTVLKHHRDDYRDYLGQDHVIWKLREVVTAAQ